MRPLRTYLPWWLRLLTRKDRKAVLEACRMAVISGTLAPHEAAWLYRDTVSLYLIGPFSVGNLRGERDYLGVIHDAGRQRHRAAMVQMRVRMERQAGLRP